MDKFFLKLILGLCLVISASFYFFLATTAGLHVIANATPYFIPGKLTIDILEGELISGIVIKNLRYQTATNTVTIASLKTEWNIKSILINRFNIKYIAANDIHIQLSEMKNNNTKWQKPDLSWLQFVNIHELTLKNIIIEKEHQPSINIHSLEIKPRYQNYSIYADLSVATALAKLTGQIGERWNLNWEISIPDLKQIDPEARGKINGSGRIQGVRENLSSTGQLRVNGFNYANGFQFPPLTINGNMNLVGELFNPNISINASLKQNDIFIPQLKIHLNNIAIDANYHSMQPIQFTSTFKSGEGSGNIVGTFQPEKEGLPVDLKIEGKNLLVANLPEYKIHVSPQLQLKYQSHETHIKGSLLDTSAIIAPTDFSNMTTLPDEAVIIDKDKTVNTIPHNLSLDIHLSLNKNTFVAYENLKTKLNGNLFITKKIGGLTMASGELNSVKGEYRAYGRLLKINQGRLIYTGSLLTNPGLDIQASKEVEIPDFDEDQSQFAKDRKTEAIYKGSKKINVGILVKGTLKKPLVSFFSNPSGIEQNDILSYLIFGYPRSKIKDMNNLSLLSNIVSGLNPGTSRVEKITGKFKNVLGLRRINMTSVETVDRKTNKSEMNTVVNIEKKLGKKFSIQYRRGLFHALNVLNLKYKINKLFSIQSETSNTDKGADFLFEYEHD